MICSASPFTTKFWRRRLANRSAPSGHVRRLRLKLGEARAHIETVVGAGYRFVARPSPGGNSGGTHRE